MENLSKYNTVFMEILLVSEADLADLKYQDVSAWDSIGHMQLMNALEETFSIELDIDDIIDFSSYAEGKNILHKYKVEFQ